MKDTPACAPDLSHALPHLCFLLERNLASCSKSWVEHIHIETHAMGLAGMTSEGENHYHIFYSMRTRF
jgi:hypothetical protein